VNSLLEVAGRMTSKDEDSERTDAGHANEYLANERTFLAWIRTSIAVISLGFVVARFSVWLSQLVISTGSQSAPKTTGISLRVGVGMMAYGALLAGLAVWRYHALNRAIREGQVGPHNTMVALVALGVIVLAGSMIVYMLFTPVSPA
jgi:putative membrane protein